MRRPVLTLSAVLLVLLLGSGCGAVVSTVFTDTGQAAPEVPAECESVIANFLMEIEPIVRNIDFDTATEEELASLGAAMEAATVEFDPDVCPDLDIDDSRAVWTAIAEQHAPGTLGYVEYTYSQD